jgi:hypothetical protein
MYLAAGELPTIWSISVGSPPISLETATPTIRSPMARPALFQNPTFSLQLQPSVFQKGRFPNRVTTAQAMKRVKRCAGTAEKI